MKAKNLIIPVLLTMLIVLLVMQGIFSCKHEGADTNLLPEICFEGQILPIFQNSCAKSGCHSQSGGESDYVCTNYNGILAAVEPGNPMASAAYTSLNAIWSENIMPPDQPLSLENRTLIRVWIEQGAKNTICPEDTSTNPPDTTINPPDTTIIEPYSNPRACYERDIQPVLTASCAFSGCHDNATHREGVNLSNYAHTLQIVSPGNPYGSLLYHFITITEPDDRMPPPPYQALSSAQKDSIFKWISYGALYEVCETGCDTLTAVTYSGFVWPALYQSCSSCHSGGSPSGGIKLTSWSEISAIANNGKLMGVLKHVSPYPLMPPGGSLSDCTIKKIDLWVSAGANNNR